MQAGCCIDGSHMSNLDFTIAVIDFAVSLGFEIDHQAYRDDLEYIQDNSMYAGNELVAIGHDVDSASSTSDNIQDIYEALDWTMQEAMDYLNDEVAPEGSHFWIHESSLFLEELDA